VTTRLWIYDKAEFSDAVEANRGLDTITIPIEKQSDHTGLTTLGETLDTLVHNGIRCWKVVFYTHGSPGLIRLAGSDIDANIIRNIQRFSPHRIFAGPGRLYFAGCNCADGEAGWKFLENAGSVFLRSLGGESFGWTSLGLSFPSWVPLIGGHAEHLLGNTRHVFIGAGGVVFRRYDPTFTPRFEREIHGKI
jgi:hypothetical protein